MLKKGLCRAEDSRGSAAPPDEKAFMVADRSGCLAEHGRVRVIVALDGFGDRYQHRPAVEGAA